MVNHFHYLMKMVMISLLQRELKKFMMLSMMNGYGLKHSHMNGVREIAMEHGFHLVLIQLMDL